MTVEAGRALRRLLDWSRQATMMAPDEVGGPGKRERHRDGDTAGRVISGECGGKVERNLS